MKLNEAIIFESRRNPHLNPKYTANDILSMYGGNKNAFVHFTNQDKLGVKPVVDTGYPNPYGVYSHPMSKIKEVTQDFNIPVFDRMFAGDLRNIFLFEYKSNNPLILSSMNIQAREFDLVRDFFISNGGGRHLEEIEQSYQKNRGIHVGFAQYLWRFVFEAIDILNLPPSKTSFIVFHKILGYDMIIDDGLGIMYGNSRSSIKVQAVHFDTRKIKVLELIENKKQEPMDRIQARNEYARRDAEIERERKSRNNRLLIQMSIEEAKKHVTDGEYPRYMRKFTEIAHMIESDPLIASNLFFNHLLSFSDEITKMDIIPTDEEISHTKSIALALSDATGLNSGMDKMSEIYPDMIFDIDLDLIDLYQEAASNALSELNGDNTK